MIDNKNSRIYPPSFDCLDISVTGRQYAFLQRKLKKENMRTLIEKYLSMEIDVLTCMINNVKKETAVNYRVLKKMNIRCDNFVMDKLNTYERILMKSKQESLKCFLFTIFMMYDNCSPCSNN